MIRKPFCEYQLYATGDLMGAFAAKPTTPGARLFCVAHLNEGHCFPCPYVESEIYEEDGRKRIAHKEDGQLVGVCEDFELPKKGKK